MISEVRPQDGPMLAGNAPTGSADDKESHANCMLLC
jgi:hypothetical protein